MERKWPIDVAKEEKSGKRSVRGGAFVGRHPDWEAAAELTKPFDVRVLAR
jgi:hypothetical protein